MSDGFDADKAGVAAVAALLAVVAFTARFMVQQAVRPFAKYGLNPLLLTIALGWLAGLLLALGLAQRPGVQTAAAWLAIGVSVGALAGLALVETALDRLAGQPPADTELSEQLGPWWPAEPDDERVRWR